MSGRRRGGILHIPGIRLIDDSASVEGGAQLVGLYEELCPEQVVPLQQQPDLVRI